MIHQLVSYEWRKALSGTLVKILVGILLFVNVVMAVTYAQERSYVSPEKQYFQNNIYALWEESPERFYQEYENLLKELEEIDIFDYPGSIYGDSNYFPDRNFESVIKVVEADKNYHQKLDGILAQARQYMSNFELDGNTDTYQYRYQSQVVARYERLNERVTLGTSPIKGWNEYFSYENEFVVVLILVALFTVNIATNDRRTGFYAIASTCSNGREQTVIAKYLTAIASTASIVLVFAMSTLISVGAVCGYSTPLEPIQAVSTMVLFPHALSIGGAVVLSVVIKLATAILFSVIVFAISALFKRTLPSYAAGIALLALQLWSKDVDVLVAGQWKYFNLWNLYAPSRFISRYRTVDIFSFSVDLTGILVVTLAIAAIVSLAVSCRVYCKKLRRTRKVAFLPQLENNISDFLRVARTRFRKPRPHLSIVRYEIIKHRLFYFLLVVFVLAKVVVSSNYYAPYDSAYDRLYKGYMDVVVGEYTEEKHDYIHSEYDAIMQTLSRLSEMEEQVQSGKITGEEYSEFYREYSMATIKRQVLSDMKTDADYLRAQYHAGNPVSFVYDVGFNRYSMQGVDWLLLAAIILFACRFYLVEYEGATDARNGMMLVRTAVKGRVSLLWRKLVLCLFTVLLLWGIFTWIDLTYLLRAYELPKEDALLISIMRYQNAPATLTIFSYIALIRLTSVVGVCVLSVVCFFAAWLMKKTIYTYASLSVLVVVPSVATSAGIEWAPIIDLTMLQNTDALFCYSLEQHRSILWFTVFLAISVLLAAIITLLGMQKTKRGGYV